MRVNPKVPGAEKNLRRFGKEIVGDELKAMQRAGGSVRSPQKKQAQRLKGWKEKLGRQSLTDKDMAWILEQVENSKSMAVSMASYLSKMERDGKDEDLKTKGMILSLKKEIYKAIHGTNVKVDARVVHMTKEDLIQQKEEIKAHIIDIMGEEQ